MLRSYIAVVSAFVLIMGGVMVSTVIAARVILGSFVPGPGVQPPPVFLAVNLAYSVAFAVSGGILAARLAPRAPVVHAAVLAGFLLVLASPSLVKPEPGAPSWYPFVISLAGPLGVLLGGWIGAAWKPRP